MSKNICPIMSRPNWVGIEGKLYKDKFAAEEAVDSQYTLCLKEDCMAWTELGNGKGYCYLIYGGPEA